MRGTLPDAAWKQFERWLDKELGGQGRGGPRYEEDVLHDELSIEAKHRSSIPKWVKEGMLQAVSRSRGRVPVLFIHEKYRPYTDTLVVMRWEDWIKLFEEDRND